MNKEADKQASKGFAKRAEALRNYFQKKSGVSDGAELKLNEISKKFLKEVSEVENQMAELRKKRNKLECLSFRRLSAHSE